MAVKLDLADIQGNILTPYVTDDRFLTGRVMLFHIENGKGAAGRKFVTELLPMISTAWRGPPVPVREVAVNIAFTYYGLRALDIPTRTLARMPDEFVDGMMKRATMLGDNFKGEKWKESWDEVWTKSGTDVGPNPHTVDILVMLNGKMNPATGKPVAALETKTSEIIKLADPEGRAERSDVKLLTGHNLPGQKKQDFQELSVILKHGVPIPKEHFGFTDGIGNPVFDGQYPTGEEQFFTIGNGAVDGKGNWRPLATGEFLLGYPDEAQEIAGAAMPLDFSRNGTFMAYRKVHQNVGKFRKFIEEKARDYAKVSGIGNVAKVSGIGNVDPARETLMAKMAGRWSDGVPVSLAPTVAEWDAFNEKYPDVDYATDPSGWAARRVAITNFKFRYPKNDRGEPDVRDDPEGTRCPLTAHMRRVNTRDMMAPTGEEGSILNNRRRILRRGLLYGKWLEDTQDEDGHERGVVMLVVCASLFRQFEFVQQQWINYGLDSRAGSDTCPIVGNHSDGTGGEHGPEAKEHGPKAKDHGPKAKFVIPADPASGHPPFIAEGIPQFVETRGGEYFFMPSMTALRMIGMGVVDPT